VGQTDRRTDGLCESWDSGTGTEPRNTRLDVWSSVQVECVSIQACTTVAASCVMTEGADKRLSSSVNSQDINANDSGLGELRFESTEADDDFLTVQGHSRSSKVDDLGTNRKRIYDFLLVINSNFGHIFALFPRYGDLLGKSCVFFYTRSYLAPSLSMFPLEFRGKVNREETRVMGIFHSEDPMIVA